MQYSFNAYGHENILATHKNTVEFTKHKELTKRGDCILGVNAAFSSDEMRKMLVHRKVKVELLCDDHRDVFFSELNKDFSDDEEIVFRKSEFLSKRTLGLKTTKGAFDIDREIVKRLRKKDAKLKVILTPIDIKVAIFDFDDTLEDYTIAKHFVENKISEVLLKRFKIKDGDQLISQLDSEMIEKVIGATDLTYVNRDLWFSELLKKQRVKFTKKDISELTELFWKLTLEHVRPMSNSVEILKHLKSKNIKIAVITDSDGARKIKIDRLAKLGIDKLVDLLVTGDDVQVCKPNQKFYDKVLAKFSCKPEECIMIGDKQYADLSLAHSLGMTTVWIKHGDYSRYHKKEKYTDHEITNLIELKDIL